MYIFQWYNFNTPNFFSNAIGIRKAAEAEQKVAPAVPAELEDRRPVGHNS